MSMGFSFSEEQKLLKSSVQDMMKKFTPRLAEMHREILKEKKFPHELWDSLSDIGIMGCLVPEEYGGNGMGLIALTMAVEELGRQGLGNALIVVTNMDAACILRNGTEEAKKRWLPNIASGKSKFAFALTEPDAGSNTFRINTMASKNGSGYKLNGQKVFITNGQNADLVITATKTDPGEGAKGVSLVLVETEREGFARGRNLEKIGYKAQDTSELFYNDVRVPKTNMLGEEGRGFQYLMEQLPQERLTVAVRSAQVIEQALAETVAYTAERQAFGRAVAEFQNTRFKLAEVKTEATICRIFVDHCIALHLRGELDTDLASMAKLYTTDLTCRLLDECLQLHGGYGYMWEFPIARAWADARVNRIAGGTSEIMKEIIARSL